MGHHKAPSIIKCGVYHVPFFTHIDKPFFAHFGEFSKRLSGFKHSYLSQMTTKNAPNISKFKLAHCLPKNVSILLLLCILRFIKQEYFFWVTRCSTDVDPGIPNRPIRLKPSVKTDSLTSSLSRTFLLMRNRQFG